MLGVAIAIAIGFRLFVIRGCSESSFGKVLAIPSKAFRWKISRLDQLENRRQSAGGFDLAGVFWITAYNFFGWIRRKRRPRREDGRLRWIRHLFAIRRPGCVLACLVTKGAEGTHEGDSPKGEGFDERLLPGMPGLQRPDVRR